MNDRQLMTGMKQLDLHEPTIVEPMEVTLDEDENSPQKKNQVETASSQSSQTCSPTQKKNATVSTSQKTVGPSHRQAQQDRQSASQNLPSRKLNAAVLGSPTDKMLSPCSKQLQNKQFLKMKTGLKPRLLAEVFKNVAKKEIVMQQQEHNNGDEEL